MLPEWVQGSVLPLHPEGQTRSFAGVRSAHGVGVVKAQSAVFPPREAWGLDIAHRVTKIIDIGEISGLLESMGCSGGCGSSVSGGAEVRFQLFPIFGKIKHTLGKARGIIAFPKIGKLLPEK